MARRKTKRKTRSRKKTGISLLGVTETFLLLNVATQTVFNNDLVNFAMGKDGGGGSSFKINLKEIMGQGSQGGSGIYQPSADKAGISGTIWGVMGHNLRKNWLSGAVQMALIPAGFRLGKRLASPAISRTNRLLNKSGVGSTVKL